MKQKRLNMRQRDLFALLYLRYARESKGKVKHIHQEAKKERPVPVAFLRDPSLLCDIMWSTQPLYTCTIRYANVSKQKFLS